MARLAMKRALEVRQSRLCMCLLGVQRAGDEVCDFLLDALCDVYLIIRDFDSRRAFVSNELFLSILLLAFIHLRTVYYDARSLSSL